MGENVWENDSIKAAGGSASAQEKEYYFELFQITATTDVLSNNDTYKKKIKNKPIQQ